MYDLCPGPALGLLRNVVTISMLVVNLFQSTCERDKNTVVPSVEINNEQENKDEE